MGGQYYAYEYVSRLQGVRGSAVSPLLESLGEIIATAFPSLFFLLLFSLSFYLLHSLLGKHNVSYLFSFFFFSFLSFIFFHLFFFSSITDSPGIQPCCPPPPTGARMRKSPNTMPISTSPRKCGLPGTPGCRMMS